MIQCIHKLDIKTHLLLKHLFLIVWKLMVPAQETSAL